MALEKYFAAKEPEDTAANVLSKANSWFNQLESNGYLDKVKDMWLAYHGAYDANVSDGHRISFTGEQGELTKINVNHFRNLGQNMLVMITSSRPMIQARATNTDYKSLVQTNLANGLLDYYMREKRLEKYLRTAVEMAIVMGSGYIKMEWNATTGEIYDYNEDTKTDVYEGDVMFSNLSAFDVIFDTTKESSDHDWVLCRSFKNRFDLAAKYPEKADSILGLPTKNQGYRYKFNYLSSDSTDDIAIYEFYHRNTESMPDGRYMLFLDSHLVLSDAPMPYRQLPVYRIVPSDILGTPFGYTPMFDLLPIQQAVNSLYSTILTNNVTFGVQNIFVQRGADININSLEGGLNLIEGNAEPKPIQLTQTAPETFKFLETLERSMETISGVNSVARGNPITSLESGTALALVQSMALQFMSGLQQSYVQLIEDVGTGLIKMLQDFAAVPRVAAIVGVSNRSYMQEFKGDDLSKINRIIVEVGNPLSRSTAGRVQMAEQLLQMKLLETPEQYFQILNTGQLNSAIETSTKELNLVQSENEALINGQDIIAAPIDKHRIHINEHSSVLADPEVRKDPRLVQKVMAHVQEHMDFLRNTDPALLGIRGEQPIGPIGGTPPANNGAPTPPGGAMGGQAANVQGQPSAQTTQASGPGQPNMPKPPAPFQNMPTHAGDVTNQ